MTATLNLTELLEFLETAGKKGWMKSATAGSMKTTCVRVLGALDPEEQVDVGKIDIDDAINRFANKNRKVSGASLSIYGSRIRSAIKMFTEARSDPTGWKPPSSKGISSPNGSKAIKAKSASLSARNEVAKKSPGVGVGSTGRSDDIADAIGRGLSYPFPLREDVTITISNIPRNLRAAEVDRITQFLKSLAIGDQSH